MGRILVYHSVAPAGDRIEQATQVSARRFREQLVWLQRAGYEVVTLAALAERGSPSCGKAKGKRQRAKGKRAVSLRDEFRSRSFPFAFCPLPFASCLPSAARRVAITFDDGYLDNYEVA